MASSLSFERIDHERHGDVSTVLLTNDIPPRRETVAEVRVTEMMELLDAYRSLHRAGIIDSDEYEAKRLVLAARAACVQRLRQP